MPVLLNKNINAPWFYIISAYCIKFFLCNLNFADLVYKINLNESVFFFFHCFWINFWYLLVFFFIIFLLYKINQTVKSLFICLFVYLTLIYLMEIFDFFIFSFQFYFFNFYYDNLNLLLLNNLNKIHPFFFYKNWVFLLTFFIIFKLNNNFYYKEHFILKIFKININKFILIFLTLYLGSWWAFQEGTWGGWWNWDSSETFGLLFFFLEFSYYILDLASCFWKNFFFFFFFS